MAAQGLHGLLHLKSKAAQQPSLPSKWKKEVQGVTCDSSNSGRIGDKARVKGRSHTKTRAGGWVINSSPVLSHSSPP